MKIEIPFNLYIEVDERREDCLREPIHCHILRNGQRVAKVIELDPVLFDFGHTLGTGEIFTVFEYVPKYKDVIKREYEKNKIYGSD